MSIADGQKSDWNEDRSVLIGVNGNDGKVYDDNVNNGGDHPLLNKNSAHYSMIGGVEAIEEMEKMFSTDELMAWSKLSAMKYRLRIGNKGDGIADIAKLQSFERYYNYLTRG